MSGEAAEAVVRCEQLNRCPPVIVITETSRVGSGVTVMCRIDAGPRSSAGLVGTCTDQDRKYKHGWTTSQTNHGDSLRGASRTLCKLNDGSKLTLTAFTTMRTTHSRCRIFPMPLLFPRRFRRMKELRRCWFSREKKSLWFPIRTRRGKYQGRTGVTLPKLQFGCKQYESPAGPTRQGQSGILLWEFCYGYRKSCSPVFQHKTTTYDHR